MTQRVMSSWPKVHSNCFNNLQLQKEWILDTEFFGSKRKIRQLNGAIPKSWLKRWDYLSITSDNCFETTGATSAGLPGLTIGEQIGGMWNSIAAHKALHDT